MRKLVVLFIFTAVFLLTIPSTADAWHRRCYYGYGGVYYPTYVGVPFHSYHAGNYGWYPGGWSRFDRPYYPGIGVGGPFLPYGGYYAPRYYPRHYGYHGYHGYGGGVSIHGRWGGIHVGW